MRTQIFVLVLVTAGCGEQQAKLQPDREQQAELHTGPAQQPVPQSDPAQQPQDAFGSWKRRLSKPIVQSAWISSDEDPNIQASVTGEARQGSLFWIHIRNLSTAPFSGDLHAEVSPFEWLGAPYTSGNEIIVPVAADNAATLGPATLLFIDRLGTSQERTFTFLNVFKLKSAVVTPIGLGTHVGDLGTGGGSTLFEFPFALLGTETEVRVRPLDPMKPVRIARERPWGGFFYYPTLTPHSMDLMHSTNLGQWLVLHNPNGLAAAQYTMSILPYTAVIETSNANDSSLQAQSIDHPSIIDGDLSSCVDEDWYAVPVDSYTRLSSINVRTRPGDTTTPTEVQVYAPDGTRFDLGTFFYPNGHSAVVSNPIIQTGTYHVRVGCNPMGSNPYGPSAKRYQVVIKVDWPT